MRLQEETNKQAKGEAFAEKKEAPIDRGTRIAIMRFFLRTSVPRILKAQKELRENSSDTGEES